MNRLEARFAALQRELRKGLIVYLGAGDPDLEQTRQLALALDRVGVDVLELGVPFSDPLADGLVNQLAAQRGLASGTTPRGVLDTVASIPFWVAVLRIATPLIFGTLGVLLCERAGVLNLGIEGIMGGQFVFRLVIHSLNGLGEGPYSGRGKKQQKSEQVPHCLPHKEMDK